MTEFASNNPWVLALLGLVLGLLLGVVGTQLFERRKTGGRTVDDVQREMDDYKEEVGSHFATTSELFRDMTEKYRDVYNHLAAGSQTLCEDSMEHARLEFAQTRSVEASDDQATEDGNKVSEERATSDEKTVDTEISDASDALGVKSEAAANKTPVDAASSKPSG